MRFTPLFMKRFCRVLAGACLVRDAGLSDIICHFAGAQVVSLQIKALLVLSVLLLHLMRQYVLVNTGFWWQRWGLLA